MTDLSALLGALRPIPRLDGAACRGNSWAFDPAEPDEDRAAVRDRHDVARSVCGNCPALTKCAQWIESLPPRVRPHGVIAGRIRLPRSVRTTGDLNANQIESTETTKGNP